MTVFHKFSDICHKSSKAIVNQVSRWENFTLVLLVSLYRFPSWIMNLALLPYVPIVRLDNKSRDCVRSSCTAILIQRYSIVVISACVVHDYNSSRKYCSTFVTLVTGCVILLDLCVNIDNGVESEYRLYSFRKRDIVLRTGQSICSKSWKLIIRKNSWKAYSAYVVSPLFTLLRIISESERTKGK